MTQSYHRIEMHIWGTITQKVFATPLWTFTNFVHPKFLQNISRPPYFNLPRRNCWQLPNIERKRSKTVGLVQCEPNWLVLGSCFLQSISYKHVTTNIIALYIGYVTVAKRTAMACLQMGRVRLPRQQVTFSPPQPMPINLIQGTVHKLLMGTAWMI